MLIDMPAQPVEKIEVLLLRQGPPPQPEVVVAEVAVQIAAIGQLEKSREQEVPLPGLVNDACETHAAMHLE